MKFFISLVLAFASIEGFSQGQFGRYSGTLKNDLVGMEQLAKLDFVFSRKENNQIALKAMLSLYFGDFTSREYVTYHYDEVNYNVLTGQLSFDQPDQEISIKVTKFANNELEGVLRSNTNGNIGALKLKLGDQASITMPLVQTVVGEYRGRCDGNYKVLQLQTSRSEQDTSRVGTPFGTFDIKGQQATLDPGCDISGGGNLCVDAIYTNGSYNFFAQELRLSGPTKSANCKVTDTGVVCDGCPLKKVSDEIVTAKAFSYPVNKSLMNFEPKADEESPALADSTASVGGEYRGYIFLEKLGVYQPASLNILTFQKSEGGGQKLILSSVAKVFFGGFGSNEGLSYRFNEKTYNILTSQFVFERIDSDMDAVLQVTKMDAETVSGTWYSILHGRVGSFILKKSALPTLPGGAVVMENISGNYTGPTIDGGFQWLANFQAILEDSPRNTRNPFYPLNIRGYFVMQGVTTRMEIAGGTYDFYTGKFSARLENGMTITGVRSDNKTFQLKWPTPGTLRPLISHKPLKFVKSN